MKKSCLPILPSRKYKLKKVTVYATIHIRTKTSNLDNAKLGGGQRKGKGMEERGTLGPSTANFALLLPSPHDTPPLSAPPHCASSLPSTLKPCGPCVLPPPTHNTRGVSSPGARDPPSPLPVVAAAPFGCQWETTLRVCCVRSRSGLIGNMSGRARVRARGIDRWPRATEVGSSQAYPTVRVMLSWHCLALYMSLSWNWPFPVSLCSSLLGSSGLSSLSALSLPWASHIYSFGILFE